MKPYIITFENGLKITILDKTITEVKERSGNFAKYGKKIDGVFSCCHNMKYTLRDAAKAEIKNHRNWIAQVQEEHQEVAERNAIVHRCNERLAKATNHNEFMNSFNELANQSA